jgi:hypothetical protein
MSSVSKSRFAVPFGARPSDLFSELSSLPGFGGLGAEDLEGFGPKPQWGCVPQLQTAFRVSDAGNCCADHSRVSNAASFMQNVFHLQ